MWWNMMGIMDVQLTNLQQLFDAVMSIWTKISEECFRHIVFKIRRRRPTPATLVASSDQSSPEIDEDRLPNQLYKAALLNSPRQRRKGQKGTPTMKELQFLVEHHLYRQQQGAGDECSSESCLSDRPSPDSVPTGEELPHDDEATAEAFEKLRCQMEETKAGVSQPAEEKTKKCSLKTEK
ncbi:protein phosphatase 1 regulatory subunit 1A-like isoform X4 [Simochromis diagramma]|uniref:protein phosphatase 1 regulatory subunit 1A-like isoform X4 n=1 Tax=Simochromis diagramma TaxID=43689 RepID=UPI001A7E9771|nr:protein phosphatase 1 regulatory subunit 1A-like isoform X4 [Simochromis diagramma]